MGHTEEKTESHVTEPAGKCGATEGHMGAEAQLPTFRSSLFGSPAKDWLLF